MRPIAWLALLVGLLVAVALDVRTTAWAVKAPTAPATVGIHCGCIPESGSCELPCGGCCKDSKPEGCPKPSTCRHEPLRPLPSHVYTTCAVLGCDPATCPLTTTTWGGK